MQTFKQILFVLILLTIGGFSNTALALCTLAEYSYNCPPNDDPSGARNIFDQSNSAAAQAEAQRQWQIREDAVQARIAKYRATPSYGALAVSDIDSSMGGGLGYKTKEDAVQHALKSCEAVGNCRVMVTFSNTCAAVASLKDELKGSKDPKTLVVATDPNPDTALRKAYAQCEARHGQGNCAVRNEAKAYCAGYDYGVFSK